MIRFTHDAVFYRDQMEIMTRPPVMTPQETDALFTKLCAEIRYVALGDITQQ